MKEYKTPKLKIIKTDHVINRSGGAGNGGFADSGCGMCKVFR